MFKVNINKEKIQNVIANLEVKVGDAKEQLKQAETYLKDIKSKLSQLDKQSAKAMAVDEIHALKAKLEEHVVKVSGDLLKTSEKFKVESTKVREKAISTLQSVKTQLKTIAETERNKRRGRSGRSEGA